MTPTRVLRLARPSPLAVAVFCVFALVASAQPANAGTARPSPTTPLSCSLVERQRGLALEQSRVLRLLSDVRVLRDQADLDRLAQPRDGAIYSLYSHMFNSIKGMGFSVVNGGVGGPGKPALLLYRPNPAAANVTDPFEPDFPYELVGWGYAGLYAPGQPPAFPDDPGLRCLRPTEWLVHERSVHPFDTWQNIPVPPAEQFHGQVAGADPPTPQECDPPCVGLAHPRLWDIHLWIGKHGVPTISMLNPGRPLPGFDPLVGVGFFYPERLPCHELTSTPTPPSGNPHGSH